MKKATIQNKYKTSNTITQAKIYNKNKAPKLRMQISFQQYQKQGY